MQNTTNTQHCLHFTHAHKYKAAQYINDLRITNKILDLYIPVPTLLCCYVANADHTLL